MDKNSIEKWMQFYWRIIKYIMIKNLKINKNLKITNNL